VAFHVVIEGHCYGALAGSEAVRVDAGEVIVFSRADAHVMASAPGLPHEPFTADAVEIATAGQTPYCINFGGSGDIQARLVCGYLACDASPFNPLLDNLPRVIKGAASRIAGRIGSTALCSLRSPKWRRTAPGGRQF